MKKKKSEYDYLVKALHFTRSQEETYKILLKFKKKCTVFIEGLIKDYLGKYNITTAEQIDDAVVDAILRDLSNKSSLKISDSNPDFIRMLMGVMAASYPQQMSLLSNGVHNGHVLDTESRDIKSSNDSKKVSTPIAEDILEETPSHVFNNESNNTLLNETNVADDGNCDSTKQEALNVLSMFGCI